MYCDEFGTREEVHLAHLPIVDIYKTINGNYDYQSNFTTTKDASEFETIKEAIEDATKDLEKTGYNIADFRFRFETNTYYDYKGEEIK